MNKKYNDTENAVDHVSEPEILYAVRNNSINFEVLQRLKSTSGLKDEVLSNHLNLNTKTFRSYKAEDKPIKPMLQEHILSLLSLYQHGIRVFGNQEGFNRWLSETNHFFDGDTPESFLTTTGGIRFVDQRLSAMEHGDNV